MFSDMYNELSQSKYGLPVEAIHLVDNLTIAMGVEELLNKHRIIYDEVIKFNCQNEFDESNDYTRPHSVGGLTIFIKTNNIEKAVIFISEEPIFIPDGDVKLDFLSMCHYMFLIHELGHVEDFTKGINIKKTENIDLVKAEAYADIFTLKKLKSKSHPAIRIALSYYAKNVIANSSKNEFYKAVMLQIRKKILLENIRKWAKS